VFNLNGGEIIVIALVALLLLGPKQLVSTARNLGRAYRRLLGYAEDFRSAIETVTEPLDELKAKSNLTRADFLQNIKIADTNPVVDYPVQLNADPVDDYLGEKKSADD